MYIYLRKSKKRKGKINFVGILLAAEETSRIWIPADPEHDSLYGSEDPYPYQDVTDPVHCLGNTF